MEHNAPIRKTRADKISLTESDLDKIEKMASLGLSINQICAILGISTDTFYRRCKESEGKLSATLLKGRSNAILNVSQKAYELALQGDTGMIKYYLSCIAGWSEKTQIMVEGGLKPIALEHSISDETLSRMANLYLEGKSKNE